MAIEGPVATREIGYAKGTSWWDDLDDETTPELRWPFSVRVYNDMRRQDAQVASVLRAVTLPVRRTPWRIRPAGARDEVVEQVAQDLGLPIAGAGDDVPGSLRTRDRFSFPTHLRHALLCLPLGHMPFEQQYRIVGTGSAARARLRKLAPRMPSTLTAINVARDGGLISIEQSGAQKPIPVSQLVMYTNDREAGNWRGTSLLRSAYKFWLLKDRMLRVQAQTIERNGMGIPDYEAGPREKALEPGQKLMQSLRAGDQAGLSRPNGSAFGLKGVEGTLPDAEPVIRYYDEQIARAVLAHFLNLGTQTGSWALGSTFADFFTLSLQTVAEDIRDVVNAHVIEDLVDINFGEDEPAPKLEFDEIGSRHPATAEAIQKLVACGAILPDRELEQFLRQQHSLPPKGSYSAPAGPAPDPNGRQTA
ncbi:MAG TPA: hypothetical protein VIP28_15160 [Nocardioides sp.]